MKALKAICWLLLAATTQFTETVAQPFRTNVNPALLYYQAFLVAPAPLAQADWDYLGSKAGHASDLPDRFGQILAGYDDQFTLVRQAARAIAPCDWGTDLSAGIDALLPYLAPAKAVAVTTRLRVQWDLQHDRQADTREDLLASFTLARNVSRDGLLMSALVQGAMEAILCTTVAENFGRFSPDSLQQLADGLDHLPARGTMAACVATEKTFSETWLLGQIHALQEANPGDDAKVMAGVHAILTRLFEMRERAGMSFYGNPQDASWWEQVSQAAGGTSGGLTTLIADLEPWSQKLSGVLTQPYGEYQIRMNQLKAEVRQAPNPLVPLLVFPTWENCRAREFKVLVFLSMVRAAIEYRLHGEAGLQSVADPCGQGPFAFRRFVFEGVDRGFELKSANETAGFTQALIFVEKPGTPFFIDGPRAGQARP
jgi:hypothetical protein